MSPLVLLCRCAFATTLTLISEDKMQHDLDGGDEVEPQNVVDVVEVREVHDSARSTRLRLVTSSYQNWRTTSLRSLAPKSSTRIGS